MILRDTSTVATFEMKAAFRFSKGRGAILAMKNDVTSAIDSPGALRGLLEDSSMRGCVIVSEVHSCSSYARLLTTQNGKTIALGLSVQPPPPGSGLLVGAKWVHNTVAGNFRWGINPTGDRTYYPLYCLVSLKGQTLTTGLG